MIMIIIQVFPELYFEMTIAAAFSLAENGAFTSPAWKRKTFTSWWIQSFI